MNKYDQELFRKIEKGMQIQYAQLESLTWLTKAMSISGSLPPLRSWATSPDILLRLHEFIRLYRPKLIVECGSGASTIVIADALKQVGFGKLISLEHSDFYGGQTLERLRREKLQSFVDMQIAPLKQWHLAHLSDEEQVSWYDTSTTQLTEEIDLLLVDGPPGKTCKYARYPAMEVFAEKLSEQAEVWMDDTIRQEEIDICMSWCDKFGFQNESVNLEKGLIVLTKVGSQPKVSTPFSSTKANTSNDFTFSNSKLKSDI